MNDSRLPQVTVIIPCYNHAHYLPYAVSSVLAQGFTNWEAIIVDDGSTDDTREVAGQFSDLRIHYLYQENQGLSAARNTGIRAAQGTYLAFLDADDEWEVRFLEVCHSTLMAQETAAAVVTRTRFMDETGTVLPSLAGQMVSAGRFRGRLLEGGFFPVHAVLVRAEAVWKAGLFDEALTSVEDWDLWLRIAAGGGTMVSIPEPLARTRVYPGSMATNAARMHANRIAVLSKQFGSPEGKPHTWLPDRRRAYAFAHRSAALGYIAQGEADEGWRHLRRGVEVYPEMLAQVNTFYELACGDQPRGFRGQADMLDLQANGAEMLQRLDALLASGGAEVQALKSPAIGKAYLALAMLADQAGDWAAARRYLLRAIRRQPRFLLDGQVVRRLAKLFLGQRVMRSMQRLRLDSADNVAERE